MKHGNPYGESSSKSIDSTVAKNNRRKIWIAFAGVAFVLVVIDLQPYFDYLSKKAKVKRLVSIGSSIDNAAAILRQNGFRTVHDKGFPTVAEDCYTVDVGVYPSRMPVTVFLGFLIRIRSMSRYIVIEAGLDGKVRTIY